MLAFESSKEEMRLRFTQAGWRFGVRKVCFDKRRNKHGSELNRNATNAVARNLFDRKSLSHHLI